MQRNTLSGGDLQQLLESLVPDIRATNEPKRQKCGAPDYITFTKKDLFRWVVLKQRIWR